MGEVEELYKIEFDEKVFTKLEKLKSQLGQLKHDETRIDSQVGLMEVGQLSGLGYADVEKQVDEYVASFNLNSLKENILKAKLAYIESLNVFCEATETISGARDEVNELAQVIEEHNKVPMAHAFRTYQDHYFLTEEYFINPPLDLSLLVRAISRQGINIYNKFPGTNSY